MNWHDYFTYDAETGSLIWKERPREHFASEWAWKVWNKQNPNNVAGSRRDRRGGKRHGVQITVANKHYWAHKAVWEMHHGPIAKNLEVDHIDRNPWNNRINNLRLATRQENAMNTGLQRNNTSGHKGICFDTSRCKWVATVRRNGRMTNLGRFDLIEDAIEARNRALARYQSVQRAAE